MKCISQKSEFPTTVYGVSTKGGVPYIHKYRFQELEVIAKTFSRQFTDSTKRVLLEKSIYKEYPTRTFYTNYDDARVELDRQLLEIAKKLEKEAREIKNRLLKLNRERKKSLTFGVPRSK